MDNMVIVLVVVAVVAVVFVGLIVLIPYLVKKGINISGVLTGTTTVLDTADHVVDTLQEFFPEVPVITVIDKVIGWAQKATEAAEQLYKTSKIEEGQRKEEATKLVYQFIEAAGIEIDDDLKKIVDGAIEAAVFALPKDAYRHRGSPEYLIAIAPHAGLLLYRPRLDGGGGHMPPA